MLSLLKTYIFLQENFEGIHQLQVIHQDLSLTPHQGINPLWYPHIQKTPLNIQMIPHPLIQDPLYLPKTMILHEFFQRIASILKKMLFWTCCIKRFRDTYMNYNLEFNFEVPMCIVDVFWKGHKKWKLTQSFLTLSTK